MKKAQDLTFSRNLAALKSQRGVTNADIAAALGVQPTAVSNYLGGMKPREDILSRLAIYFQISVRDLCEADSPVAGSLVANGRQESPIEYLTRLTVARTSAIETVDRLIETHEKSLRDLAKLKRDLLH